MADYSSHSYAVLVLIQPCDASSFNWERDIEKTLLRVSMEGQRTFYGRSIEAIVDGGASLIPCSYVAMRSKAVTNLELHLDEKGKNKLLHIEQL